MKVLACLFLFRILDIADTIKSKSVNLALETVLEFDNKDNSRDLQFISKVQTFLDKIKTIIYRTKSGRRSYRNVNHETFTGFIQKAIDILNTYDNEDLEDVFAVIDNELRKYHYKGCKFYELMENNDVRRYMASSLNSVRNKTPEEIKVCLQTVKQLLKLENYDPKVKDFIDYINSLYRYDAKKKFTRFLSNLEIYKSKSKRANLDLIKIVRDGIRSILFDHYTGLNQNARRELKLKIETFWKEFSDPKYIRHNVWNIKYTRNGEEFGIFDIVQVNNSTENNLTATESVNITTTPTTKSELNITVPTNWIKHITITRKLKSTRSTIKSTAKKRRPKKATKKWGRMKNLESYEHYYDHDDNISNDVNVTTKHTVKTTYKPKPRYQKTTLHEKIHTLWEETVTSKKPFSKPKPLRKVKKRPIKTIISKHEAVIDVKRTDMPEYVKTYDYETTRRNRFRKQQRHDTGKYHVKNERKKHDIGRYHERIRHTKPLFRLYAQEDTKKYTRKSFEPIISSDEGMSIEGFEGQGRASLRKSNDNDTFGFPTTPAIDNSVIKRLNNLERELNDMKSKMISENVVTKIDNVRKTIENYKPAHENYALDFWVGTSKSTKATANTEIATKAATSSRTSTSTTAKAMRAISTENITKTESPLPKITSISAILNLVDSKNYQNVSQDGIALNKITYRGNNRTNIARFNNDPVFRTQNENVSLIDDIKNEVNPIENITTTTVRSEIPKLDVVSKFHDDFDNRFEEAKSKSKKELLDEKIKKHMDGIIKHISNGSVPADHLSNITSLHEIDDPLKDIDDDIDFL